MLTELTARRLITSEAVIEWPRIAFGSDGMIASVEAGEQSAAETTLTAAFFDVHVHGAAGLDVMEGTAGALGRIGKFLTTKGTAYFLATTVTAPVETTLRALDGLAAVIQTGAVDLAEAVPVGIHLEGPFISHAKRGVHPPADIQTPSVALFTRLQEAACGYIKLMTIAPEVPGALDLIEHAVAAGVKVSLGHSDATARETRAAIEAGATSATHTFNAMRRLDHREPGIAGVVLDAGEMYAELICDGIHVAPEMVRLWMQAKGEERAILVTDGISATGMPDGEYLLGEFAVTVAYGRCLLASDLHQGVETLAGSVLTMDRAVANLRRFTDVEIATAVRMASRNPARMLGMATLCEIEAGRPANFNVYSSEGVLVATVLRGRRVSLAN